jgi:hypothetical protein
LFCESSLSKVEKVLAGIKESVVTQAGNTGGYLDLKCWFQQEHKADTGGMLHIAALKNKLKCSVLENARFETFHKHLSPDW